MQAPTHGPAQWDQLSMASNEDILEWARRQTWAEDMARCQQDNQWHAEGDVWCHTEMACDELAKLPEWAALNRMEQLKLLFTGIFHDSGKPTTTEEDPKTGRIHSPKHALFGAEIARQELRKTGCPLEFRESICNLVRYHSRPQYLLEYSDPEREVIALSWLVSHRLLLLFARADTRGRKTRSNQRAEDALELWKSTCMEQECFDQPYAFANDQARFLFFRNQLPNRFYHPHEAYTCQVLLLSGLPGAGKDTWLKKFHPQLLVVGLDSIRDQLDIEPTDEQGPVVQAARELARIYLRARRDFAFNATNITKMMRQKWISLFADYHARIQIVYVEPTVSKILEQNSQRTKAVPERVMQKLLDKLEVPTFTEAHGLEYVSKF